MEHESETPLLYDTPKSVWYSLVCVAHAVFIILALTGTVMLLAVLLFDSIT